MTQTTLSNVLESFANLQARKKELELDLKTIDTEIETLTKDIMHAMDDDGVTETGNGHVKVAIKEAQYPQVEDWDAFYAFIKRNDYLHLLQRRPAVEAYRELLTAGQVVPGVVPFTKRTLYFRES